MRTARRPHAGSLRSRSIAAAGAILLVAALGGCTAPVPSTPSPPSAALPPSSRSTSVPASSPPSVASTPTGAGATVEQPIVVLDPGHNGRNGQNPAVINRLVPDGRGGTKACNTTGTETDAGYPEHAFTFDVAGRIAVRLRAAGVQVVLTRPDDNGVGPCVDERGRAGEAADADAVVSIHADGSAAGNSGFHVALSDPPLNPAQERPARALAVALRDAMRAGGFPDSDYIGSEGLSPRPDLAGLNFATRPTAVIECANMRNPTEAALVSTPEGRDRYAAAIAAGTLAFLARS